MDVLLLLPLLALFLYWDDLSLHVKVLDLIHVDVANRGFTDVLSAIDCGIR